MEDAEPVLSWGVITAALCGIRTNLAGSCLEIDITVRGVPHTLELE